MTVQESPKASSLDKQSFGLIIGLSLQYILGITTTFFVKFPENLPQGQAWGFAFTQLPLALHIILGLFLLLGSIALFVRAIRMKQKTWIIAATIGLVTILATVVSGSVFVETKSDGYSFSMAIGFIIALFAYVWGIYTSKIRA